MSKVYYIPLKVNPVALLKGQTPNCQVNMSRIFVI